MIVHGGRVPVAGVDVESHILPTSTLSPLTVHKAKFDVTEVSVSSYLLQV